MLTVKFFCAVLRKCYKFRNFVSIHNFVLLLSINIATCAGFPDECQPTPTPPPLVSEVEDDLSTSKASSSSMKNSEFIFH